MKVSERTGLMKVSGTMQIRTRMLLAFAAVAILLGGVGAASQAKLRMLADDAASVHRHDVLPMETLAAISRHFISARVEVRDAIFQAQLQRPGEAAARNGKAVEHLRAVDRLADEYARQIHDPAEQALHQSLRKHLAAFGAIAAGVTELSGAAQPARAVEMVLTRCTEAADKVNGVIDELMKLKQKRAADHSTSASADAHALMVGQALALVAGLLASIVLALWISNSISGPVSRLAQAADQVAMGQLDIDVKLDRGDELGRLAASFDVAIANTRALVRQVNAAVEATEQAGLQLARDGGQLAATLAEQATRSDATARSVSGIVATIEDGAKRATEAVADASQACEEARSSGAVVLASVSAMNEIASVVAQSERSLADLSTGSERIGRIVAVIEGIATQTGLLSLNAAIEAARAGEQGRGFAVVADEVRKLSQRTQEATREVSETVALIQSGTAQAALAMREGSERAESEKIAANAVSLAMQSIIERTQRLDQIISGIAAASIEQARSGGAASAEIEAVGSASRRSVESTKALAGTAEALAASTGEVRHLLARFTVA